jgi:hypothetical protein
MNGNGEYVRGVKTGVVSCHGVQLFQHMCGCKSTMLEFREKFNPISTQRTVFLEATDNVSYYISHSMSVWHTSKMRQAKIIIITNTIGEKQKKKLI